MPSSPVADPLKPWFARTQTSTLTLLHRSCLGQVLAGHAHLVLAGTPRSSDLPSCSKAALRSDRVHQAAHAAPLPCRDGRWWDGSRFTVPESTLGHRDEPVTVIDCDGSAASAARPGE